MFNSSFAVTKKVAWLICALFCATIVVQSGFIEVASATGTADPIGDTLCKVSNMLTGRGGKAIATIGLVALGIGLFLGKLSWGLAIATGIGIMLIFGSGDVIKWIGGTAGSASCPTNL
jgi:type IV secretory pathway VirB2 component (pilin)